MLILEFYFTGGLIALLVDGLGGEQSLLTPAHLVHVVYCPLFAIFRGARHLLAQLELMQVINTFCMSAHETRVDSLVATISVPQIQQNLVLAVSTVQAGARLLAEVHHLLAHTLVEHNAIAIGK